jgi:hypothetical protein
MRRPGFSEVSQSGDTSGLPCAPVACPLMKTRTLLLLSVGTALMILLAGGGLLFQLSNQESTTDATPLGTAVTIGDVDVTVVSASVDGERLMVSVQIGGVDDVDGIDSFRLVTGDRRLDPIAAPADGRCGSISLAAQACTIEFDISASEGTSRVMVLRRGEEQATWRLG